MKAVRDALKKTKFLGKVAKWKVVEQPFTGEVDESAIRAAFADELATLFGKTATTITAPAVKPKKALGQLSNTYSQDGHQGINQGIAIDQLAAALVKAVPGARAFVVVAKDQDWWNGTYVPLGGRGDGDASFVALVGKVGDRLAGITIASAALEVVEVSV